MKRIVIPIATFENGKWVLNIELIDQVYCRAMKNGFSLGPAEFDPTLSKEKRREELAKVFEGMKQMVLKENDEPLNEGVPKLEISYLKFIKTDEPVTTEMKDIKQWLETYRIVATAK